MFEPLKTDFCLTSWTRRGAVLVLACASVMLGGCLYSSSFDKKYDAEYEKLRAEQAEVRKYYIDKLANDPELAIIRGKSGISFNSSPLDNFDDALPTQAERVAIKKYGMLMREYFDKMCEFEEESARKTHPSFRLRALGGARDVCQTQDAHVEAVATFYRGKMTWADFGRLVNRIDKGFGDRMHQRHEESARAFDATIEKMRKEDIEERRHQETIRAQQKSTTSTCTIIGGVMSCTHR